MNAFTMKALLLSVVTEIKFGQPLTPHAATAKRRFKQLVGLPKGASNLKVLAELKRTYEENKLADDFNEVVTKFNVKHLLTA